MKKYVVLFLFIYITGTLPVSALKGMTIDNNCDILFPKELRNNPNTPQYISAYKNCIKNYTIYMNNLFFIKTNWQDAEKNNTEKDWNNIYIKMQEMYEIMKTDGEILTDWFYRDIVMGEINEWMTLVKGKIEYARTLENEKYVHSTVVDLNNFKLSVISVPINKTETGGVVQSGIVKTDIEITSCRSGYLLIKKTGKCRKVFKKKNL